MQKKKKKEKKQQVSFRIIFFFASFPTTKKRSSNKQCVALVCALSVFWPPGEIGGPEHGCINMHNTLSLCWYTCSYPAFFLINQKKSKCWTLKINFLVIKPHIYLKTENIRGFFRLVELIFNSVVRGCRQLKDVLASTFFYIFFSKLFFWVFCQILEG